MLLSWKAAGRDQLIAQRSTKADTATGRRTIRIWREKKGRGRQVRTKSFHSLQHTFVSRLANADGSAVQEGP